jgi:hypothetical protein
MFAEAGERHHRPHFHAHYQGQTAIFAIDAIERIGGTIPVSQERLVMAWAEIHKNELLQCWEALQAGAPPFKIDPLR